MGKKKRSKAPKKSEGDSDVIETREEGLEIEGAIKSNKIIICKGLGCHDMATMASGYCRLHYLSGWRKLKTKEAKRKGQDLTDYMKFLSGRFPEDFFEKLRNELEEMTAEADSSDDNSSDRAGSLFEPEEGDDDVDTIIKGIRVEDF